MGSQNGYVIWPPPPLPLPVELISFDATLQNEEVHLLWTTATERDISHFAIHRSTDLLEKAIIGVHPARGNSNSMQHYLVRDAPRSSAQYYYHLDEVAPDGTSMEIAISTIRFENKDRILHCKPNPLSRLDVLTVDVPDHRRGLDVRLIGTAGKWMSPSSVDMDGSLMVIMDGLHLSNGIYSLQVLEGGTPLGTCRFVLQ